MSSKQRTIYRIFLVFICLILCVDLIPNTGFTSLVSAQVDERSFAVNETSEKNSTISAVPLPQGKVLYYPFDEQTTTIFPNTYGTSGDHIGAKYYSLDLIAHNSYGSDPQPVDPNDAKVYPIAGGRVIHRGYRNEGKGSWGNWVVIHHEDSLGFGFVSIYGHLQSNVKVNIGDAVNVNTWIGTQGNSGKGFSGGVERWDYVTHLHLSLMHCENPDDAKGPGSEGCDPVLMEPLVGKHVDEKFNWWNRTDTTYGIGVYQSEGNGSRIINPALLSDNTAPEVGWWNDATTSPNSPEDPLSKSEPIVFDIHFEDYQSGIGEIRLTANYEGWFENPNGAWRIIARCRPDEDKDLLCQNNTWHHVWDWANETKGNYTATPVKIPWMDGINPNVLGETGPRAVCISFDIFDKAGNARYAPQGTQCNQLPTINAADNTISVDDSSRLIYLDTGQSYPSSDNAEFVADIALSDGIIVSPNSQLLKTWRMRNTGTSEWNSSYKLVFVSGEQMGAPSETSVPSTAPNQTVDLSVSITAPATAGEHTGYFQLRNPQGTYFGPQIWVKINVRSASNKIIILSADPPSPANTSTVRIRAKVDGMSNLRAMRLKIDGEVRGEFGGPEYIFTWNTAGYTAGEHNIVIEVADQTDTSWSHPETRSISYTLQGTSASPNLKPNAPSLISPYDWYVYYSGNTGQLCAQANGDPDGDGISAYYFEIYESAQSWSSGWIGSNCVTTAALGPYNYKWHVKVMDSRGAESDWSTDRNFTLVNPNLTITQLYFEPQDGNSDVVKIRACTAGLGGVGITMRVDVNDANDGSANGQWHRIKELGVPCFNDIDAPIWQTLEAGGNYGDGAHLVRVEAHSANTGWDGAAVREATYYLPHRRPSRFPLVAPVSSTGNYNNPVFLNSPTVALQWGAALRANTYTLSIGFEQHPADSLNPLYRQTFGSDVTQQTVTFSQNYPALYWQVRAANEMGYIDSDAQIIGIDQTLPACSIHSLPGVSYENNFQVNWAGEDAPSGIFTYDIQYLDSDRGSWSDWLTVVPANKVYELFSGQAGHSYSFRCRAVDHAGNLGSFESSGISTIKIDPAARPVEFGSADLLIESLIAYPNPSGGILVEAGVKNNGTVNTVNGFYTDLYLNHLPTGSDDLTGSLKFWVNDPIPAGGTATLSTFLNDFNQLGLTATVNGEEVTNTLYAQTDSTGSLIETDKQNNIYSDGVPVCTAAGDAYEGSDNSPSGAPWLTEAQTHNFDKAEDEDWMKLTAIEGQFYRIVTSELGPTTDTYMYLYDQDGFSLLASNDDAADGSLTSQIEWVAPADGTYYILVKQWNPSVWGCGTWWSVTVQTTSSNRQVYLPLVIQSSQDQWNTILYEGFEGAFPGNWGVYDYSGLGFEWKDRSCTSSAGGWSGWAMGGGTGGLALSCDSNYVNNALTWMYIGTFDLSDAMQAELNFDLWLNTEAGYDSLSWGVFDYGESIYMVSQSGNTNGWVNKTLDLSNVDGQNFLGKSQISIAFLFRSDESVTYPVGAIIDEIVLRKCVGGVCP